jgi:hypothetical protein
MIWKVKEAQDKFQELISELARPRPNPGVIAWSQSKLFLLYMWSVGIAHPTVLSVGNSWNICDNFYHSCFNLNKC